MYKHDAEGNRTAKFVDADHDTVWDTNESGGDDAIGGASG
jgi:hypothetical protein